MTKTISGILDEIGLCVLFVKDLWRVLIKTPCTMKQINEQIWYVATQSVSTTAMAGFFVGGIMTVQFTMQVKEFGALGYLGGLSTSGTIREIGPLLIAFMLSGKVGAFTSAELGTMKVTEQIDAIRCLGANPLQEIILPRFIGILIASFFLLSVGLYMSIGGGVLMGMIFANINPVEYVRHIPTIVTLPSIITGLFKCFVFAFILGAVCTYKDYTARGGAKGVGKAVVNTAVGTMVGIVVADWVCSVISESVLNMFIGVF